MSKMVGFEGYTLPGELPDGWYHVTIEEVSDAPSKKGDPMVTVRFAVDDKGEMVTNWYSLESNGKRNDFSYRQLMELSFATGMGTEGGYDLQELVGKKCGARLYMDGDFIRVGKCVNPDETEIQIEWLNEDDTVPF